MRNLLFRSTSLGLLLVVGVVGLPLGLALAHEAHHAECSDTAINSLKADIQVMSEGEAKTTAMKELKAAQQMRAKNDVEACKGHIHSAIEATEK
jgi:hypothetical protein